MQISLDQIEDLRRKLGDAEHGIEVLKGHNQSWMDDCAEHLERIASLRLTLMEVRGNGEWATDKAGKKVWIIGEAVYQMVYDELRSDCGVPPKDKAIEHVR